MKLRHYPETQNICQRGTVVGNLDISDASFWWLYRHCARILIICKVIWYGKWLRTSLYSLVLDTPLFLHPLFHISLLLYRLLSTLPLSDLCHDSAVETNGYCIYCKTPIMHFPMHCRTTHSANHVGLHWCELRPRDMVVYVFIIREAEHLDVRSLMQAFNNQRGYWKHIALRPRLVLKVQFCTLAVAW